MNFFCNCAQFLFDLEKKIAHGSPPILRTTTTTTTTLLLGPLSIARGQKYKQDRSFLMPRPNFSLVCAFKYYFRLNYAFCFGFLWRVSVDTVFDIKRFFMM